MSLFWIGVIVFIAGVLVRCGVRLKYYRDCKTNAHTTIQAQEMKSKYRPAIFAALVIEVIGCIITVISIWK